MNDILQTIQKAEHIVIIASTEHDVDSLGAASALYTYVLTLHKKVSFYCGAKTDSLRFSFLPWYDKIRQTPNNSADLAISLGCVERSMLGAEVSAQLVNIDYKSCNSRFGDLNLVDENALSTTHVVFGLLTNRGVKLNQKMATALYAGILEKSESFSVEGLNGTPFACAKVLLEAGAEYELCNRFIIKYISLAVMRLKAAVYEKAILVSEAEIVFVSLLEDDFKRSGAALTDLKYCLNELLYLPHAKAVVCVVENNTDSLHVRVLTPSKKLTKALAKEFEYEYDGCSKEFSLDISEKLENITKKIKEINREGILG